MTATRWSALLDRYAATLCRAGRRTAPRCARVARRRRRLPPRDRRAATWLARAVVIATGACQRAAAARLRRGAAREHRPGRAAGYRRPADLPDGGVLVVGGSSTGLQLAAARSSASGRPVTLAVGRHLRMVRRYRGRDIFAWLEATGITGERWRADSRPRRRTAAAVDAALGPRSDRPRAAGRGGRAGGRPGRAASTAARLALGDDLAADCAASDARLRRVLGRIDAHIAAAGDRRRRADPAAWRDAGASR